MRRNLKEIASQKPPERGLNKTRNGREITASFQNERVEKKM